MESVAGDLAGRPDGPQSSAQHNTCTGRRHAAPGNVLRCSLTDLFAYVAIAWAAACPAHSCLAETAGVPYQAGGTPQETTGALHEIVVTGHQPTSVFELPRSASVISALDIERSGAANLTELLAREANLVLTSFSGNDKFSQLDVRGSGDTAASNILTLVDGARINSLDLSGADFAQIALSQIERIEIVRGANTVRFGSGAAHGVINIITKAPAAGVGGQTRARHASFNSNEISQQLSLASNTQDLLLHARYADSDGYREHSGLKRKTVLAKWRIAAHPRLDLKLSSRRHRDEYQLPGPLAQATLVDSSVDRRSADPAETSAGTTANDHQLLQLSWRQTKTLQLHTQLDYSDRDSEFVMSDSPTEPANFSATPSARRDRIITRATGVESVATWAPRNVPLSVNLGLGYLKNDYSRSNGGQYREDRLRNRGALISRAAFVSTAFNPGANLRLTSGYRRETTRNRFAKTQLQSDESSNLCTRSDSVIPGVGTITLIENCPLHEVELNQQHDTWRNQAFEAGINWSIAPPNLEQTGKRSKLYANYAKTYRNPNVDELALGPDNGQPLVPQSAERYEAGIKVTTARYDASAGLFHFTTQDEIIFRSEGVGAAVNRNSSEPIERRGVELQAHANFACWTLDANLGYTRAKTPDRRRVPLVPSITASFNANWRVTPRWAIDANTSYVGERADGNSFDGASYRALASHTLTDLQASFSATTRSRYSRPINYRIFLGANNVFDEQYFSSSYSERAYPAAGIYYFGGLSIEL